MSQDYILDLIGRSCYVRFICPAARNMKEQSCRKRRVELSTLSSPSLLQATRKKNNDNKTKKIKK